MELDKRIKSIDSIRCFNTNNDDCFGKFGYFTNFVKNFDNLDKTRKGNCGFKDGSCFPFYESGQPFQFFIPDSELLPRKPKEKQYRPFTLNEFLHIYELGDIVTFRCKYNDHRYAGIATGYEAEKDEEKAIIHIGCYSYLLSVLFTDYERINSEEGEWVPFGVEVEE